jgi:hypothetical protein
MKQRAASRGAAISQMGRAPPLSELKKGHILGLHEAKPTVRAIARRVRRSKDAAHRVIQDAII